MESSATRSISRVLWVHGGHRCLLVWVGVVDNCPRSRAGGNGRHLTDSSDVTSSGPIPMMNQPPIPPANTMRTQNLGSSRNRPVIVGTLAIEWGFAEPLA